MRYFKYLVFSLMLFIGFNCNVMAEACDSDDIARLKEIANNVSTSYYYNEEAEEEEVYGSHIIVISGLTDEIYGKISMYDSELFFYYDDDNLGNIEKNIGSGPRTLEIYSRNCNDLLLRKIEVDVPYYNIYSSYEECENISGDDLEVCSKFLDKEITESVFKNAIKKYNERQSNVLNKSIGFFEKYKFVFISIFSVGILLFVFFIIRKNKYRNELS